MAEAEKIIKAAKEEADKIIVQAKIEASKTTSESKSENELRKKKEALAAKITDPLIKKVLDQNNHGKLIESNRMVGIDAQNIYLVNYVHKLEFLLSQVVN